MDRLPLVQALTEAGLERRGAEQVATALGEAIESSVATKADFARLEASIAQLGVSTKADTYRLENTLTAQDASTKIEFSRVRAEMQAMELRLTLRLGGLMITLSGLLFAALRFIGHAP